MIQDNEKHNHVSVRATIDISTSGQKAY